MFFINRKYISIAMKQEELLKLLVNELFKMDTLHQEYQDNDTHIVVDSQREGNTLNIKVQLLENKDKKEFDEWLSRIDDDLFSEILEELQDEGISNLDEMYNSEDYALVIDKVKSKAKEIVAKKIKSLQSLIN